MSFRNTKAIFGSNHKENNECKLDPAIFSSFSIKFRPELFKEKKISKLFKLGKNEEV